MISIRNLAHSFAVAFAISCSASSSTAPGGRPAGCVPIEPACFAPGQGPPCTALSAADAHGCIAVDGPSCFGRGHSSNIEMDSVPHFTGEQCCYSGCGFPLSGDAAKTTLLETNGGSRDSRTVDATF